MEDEILEDSLDLFGDRQKPENTIRYGHISIEIPSREGKAISLLADQLFSPSLALAELIETGQIRCNGLTWLELGAGTGLVSLVAASSENAPKYLVVTDYPDDIILGILKKNVKINEGLINGSCSTRVEGYAWGETVDHLLVDATVSGFDVLVLSDLLYFDKCHDILLKSIVMLLSRTRNAAVYVAAGKYTPIPVCDHFLKEATKLGLEWEEIDTSGEWKGTTITGTHSPEQLRIRKNDSYVWIGRWSRLD